MRALAVALGAAVIAAAAGAAPAPPELRVAMPGKVYAPGDVDILLGTAVVWQNTDSATHTVTADDDSFDSGHLRPGQEFTQAFSASGTVAYHCTIHRFMRGRLSVYALVLRGPERPLLSGFTTRLEGRAPPGSPEVVLERVSRAGAVEVRRAAPSPEGAFAFAVRLGAPAAYRVRAGTATSPVLAVPVAPHVSLERSGGSLRIHATPARPGSRVVLQAYERERFTWATVAQSRLGLASTTVIRFVAPEGAHVRAVVRGSGGWGDGVSPVRVLPPS
jgi:plastocyanin